MVANVAPQEPSGITIAPMVSEAPPPIISEVPPHVLSEAPPHVLSEAPPPMISGAQPRMVAAASSLRLGPRTFAGSDLVIMAIVNRTPDSFYDRGATFTEDAALRAVERAVADGADIIDIGGVKAG